MTQVDPLATAAPPDQPNKIQWKNDPSNRAVVTVFQSTACFNSLNLLSIFSLSIIDDKRPQKLLLRRPTEVLNWISQWPLISQWGSKFLWDCLCFIVLSVIGAVNLQHTLSFDADPDGLQIFSFHVKMSHGKKTRNAWMGLRHFVQVQVHRRRFYWHAIDCYEISCKRKLCKRHTATWDSDERRLSVSMVVGANPDCFTAFVGLS